MSSEISMYEAIKIDIKDGIFRKHSDYLSHISNIMY